MKSIAIIIALLILGLTSCASPQPRPGNTKETFHFATRDGKKLYLDKLVDTTVVVMGKRPVFMWSFGGGWETGERYDKVSSHLFDYLTSLGFTVVTIDYRLTIKEAKAAKTFNDKNALSLYLAAIENGVEDLFDATRFVLSHAKEWDIDATQIVISGASAGATNSVVAENQVCNNSPLFQKYLPSDFNYAGVVSMAGALWLKGEHTPAVWGKRPCPYLFFHGSKDQLVTYEEAHVPGMAGYGPTYLYKQFSQAGYPIWFYDMPGADHVVSMAPVYDNLGEIGSFLNKFVKEKQDLTIHTIEVSKTPKTFGNLGKLYGKYLLK